MLKDAAKASIKSVVHVLSPVFIRNTPIKQWPGWLGRVHGVKVPQAVVAKHELDATGTANINMLIRMIDQTRDLPGDIADCGVLQGAVRSAWVSIYGKRELRR